MERFLNIHYMVGVHLCIIALVIGVAAFSVHSAKSETRMLLESNIDRQLALITELAELTDHNGADSVVESIITDCPRRNEFENLLNKLGSLSHSQLLDTQSLFESCGGFYAERKALMVSRLEREYDVLTDNVDLLHALDSNNNEDYKLEKWQQLIEQEQKRNDLLSEQLGIQRDIITVLISGKTTGSKEITDLANEANQVADSLSVLDKQIDALRSELVK